MPDLENELRALVHRLEPGDQPPFAELSRRHRRRRAATAVGGASLIAAITVTAVVVGPRILTNDGNSLAMTSPSTATSAAPSSDPALTASPDPITPTVPLSTPTLPPTTQGLPSQIAHPCPSGSNSEAMIDYADVLQLDGRNYMRVRMPQTVATRRIAVGDPVAAVTCTLMGSGAGSTYHLQDGDATILPAGTTIDSVPGFDPRLRVSAISAGTRVLYEAFDPGKTAKSGADVFPGLRENVVAIVLLSEQDDATELGRISDAGTVGSMVDALMSAPYKVELGAAPEATDMFLGLVLKDGSVVSRQYASKSGVLLPGLTLPASFRQAILAAKK